MPYSRPGYMKYVTATKAVMHGAPATESNFVGVAVKQKAPGAGDGAGTPQKQIGVGEDFVLISKGVVQVHNIIGAAVGDLLYIATADNALSESSGGGLAFGRVTELAGTRGTPAGMMRVDLDNKV